MLLFNPPFLAVYNHFSNFLFFDGQIFRKGKKSRLFYTFCQLHLDVAIRTHFFKLNTILLEDILTVQKWP